MKSIILVLLFVLVCSYINILGCGGGASYRYVARIESYNPGPNDKMCRYIIDSAGGELTLAVGDTICIECVKIDTAGNLGCLSASYVSPVKGIIYKLRLLPNFLTECSSCTLADGVYLRKFRYKPSFD